MGVAADVACKLACCILAVRIGLIGLVAAKLGNGAVALAYTIEYLVSSVGERCWGGRRGLGTVFANADGGVKGDERTGLERQRQAIAAASSRRGWHVLTALEETRLSAMAPDPAGLETALLASKEVKPLLVEKRGPLCGLVGDLGLLIEKAQTQGWALVSLHSTLDQTTPRGDPLAKLVAGFVPCRHWLHAQRVREGLARKRAQGVRLGRPVTMSAYAIERIKREHRAGHSLTQIANGLNTDKIPTAQGGQAWYPATIRSTLKRTN